MNSVSNNLPLQLSSFIGRKQEIAVLRRLLASSRLVTLTGAGGCGKTRLALEVATAGLEHYPDGVWFVDLAPLSDPALVLQTVASVLNVPPDVGKPWEETLSVGLRQKRLLLLLDNCEHLIEACAQLADTLLRSCANVNLLATSREALRLTGEALFPLLPLAVPQARVSQLPEALLQSDAVQLFLDRARSVRPSLALTEQNAEAIARICQRVDGIPLALELAAAQVGTLSLAQIAERLENRFTLLTRGRRTALPRQQTMRATVEWSRALLTEDEQVLFRRLAVFAGGWTTEAAEATCHDEKLTGARVGECLSGLVDKSLVIFDEQEGAARYRMLETIRELAVERLEAAGELKMLRDRHLVHLCAFAELAEAQILDGRDLAARLNRVEAELDNIRAALAWSESAGAGAAGLALAGALFRFWEWHSHLSEGRDWLRRMLKISGDAPLLVRARGLHAASWMETDDGQFAVAKALATESLALFRAAEKPREVASVLQSLGYIAKNEMDPALALAHHTEFLAIGRGLQDTLLIFWGLVCVAEDRFLLGEREPVVQLLDEALDLATHMDNIAGIANTMRMRGDVAFATGQLARARDLYAQAVSLRRKMGYKKAVVTHLRALGKVVLAQGDAVQALAHFRESLDLAREAGFWDTIAADLAAIAAVAARRGHDAEAIRIAAAVATLLETRGLKLVYGHNAYETDQIDYDETLASLKQRCDPVEFARLWAEGQAMNAEQAFTEAQLVTVPQEAVGLRHSSLDLPAAAELAGLSAREVEVLRLVAHGLTNPQIAEQLVISTRTVNAHLRSIYGKLNVTTRTAAARYATDNKLS